MAKNISDWKGKEMNINSQHLDRRQFLTIYKSEAAVIAGISAHWGRVETGVEFFGTWSNKGLPIIQLVIGPGPQAVHQPCHYEQDLEFLRRIHNIITSEYGLEWIGGGHCHHELILQEPSFGDLKQVMGVTARNGLNRWCEIITTFVNSDESQKFKRKDTWFANEDCNKLKVRFNAYLYTDAPRGEREPVPIRVLPGISPYRKELLKNKLLSPTDIGTYAAPFPLENVLYDSLEPKESGYEPVNGIFDFLTEQCRELPEKAQEGIGFSETHDSVIVTLPLFNNDIAYLEYKKKPPYKIVDVSIMHGNVKVDEVLKDSDKQETLTLNKVYQALITPQTKVTRGIGSWSKMKMFFESATHVATSCIKRVRYKE
jgi:hypothetical protein